MTSFRLPPGTNLRNTLEIKRSQFITIVRRVATLEEARENLAEIRAEFPDARHHCSASIISIPGANDILHSSDDGEPSGTAGRPMLDVLVGAKLTDVVAIVVRYFGGTLLGTGGLVRAYSESVRECIYGAEILSQKELTHVEIFADHTFAGRLEADLRGIGHEIITTHYEASGARIELAVANVDTFQTDVAALSSGQITPQILGPIWREIPAGVLQ
ncbi:MAG: YigZ family protein [Arcanobacterium sp.]|nr:YigZ family protein [Arcanobacterium sp.]